ncbi:hypothetical protein ABT160_31205 [Streptomyces sp. NPDC001941]|uniref:hypothetical protein n=1 Tax=Streptomyces sp. NPDC001941 TaxID=3154659 RepID=UPI00333329D9
MTRTTFASTLPGMGSTVTKNLTHLGKPLVPPAVPKDATDVAASMAKGAFTGSTANRTSHQATSVQVSVRRACSFGVAGR